MIHLEDSLWRGSRQKDREMVIVHILKRVYQMSNAEAEGLLKIASDSVSFGIYAVRKDNQIQMLNIKCESKTQLKAETRAWKRQGYKVYSNGL